MNNRVSFSLIHRPQLLSAAVAATALAVGLWTAMAIPRSARWIQTLDERFLDIMTYLEWTPLVALAVLISVVGGVWITAPLRILVAIRLWNRKDWSGLLIWVFATLPAQLIASISKLIYLRPRPTDGIGDSITASFPSEHSTDAAVMSLALVFILIPASGSRRRFWMIVAVCYALMMACTRIYLRMHWVSDFVGGLLLGGGCALWAVTFSSWLFGHNRQTQANDQQVV